MRRLVATSLLLACAGLTGCGLLEADAEPVAELGPLETFTTKNLRIELPCVPARASQSAPVVGRTKPLPALTWTCEGPDSAYAVSTMRLPADVQGNIKGAAQGAAEAINGTVVLDKRATYAGSPARDVRIEGTRDGEPFTMFGRVLVRDRVLYQVQAFALGKHTTEAPRLYAKVLKSLRFG